MPDATDPDEAARRELRQRRLQQLRQSRPRPLRRVGGGGAAGAAEAGGLAALAGEVQHRRALTRIVRILRDTPADAEGEVPGTNFTRSGVAALVAELDRRSGTPGAPGAKVAETIRRFLSPSPEEVGEPVHGISLQRLQRLSQLVDRLRGRGAAGRAASD